MILSDMHPPNVLRIYLFLIVFLNQLVIFTHRFYHRFDKIIILFKRFHHIAIKWLTKCIVIDTFPMTQNQYHPQFTTIQNLPRKTNQLITLNIFLIFVLNHYQLTQHSKYLLLDSILLRAHFKIIVEIPN
jgi:hypothetical protein